MAPGSCPGTTVCPMPCAVGKDRALRALEWGVTTEKPIPFASRIQAGKLMTDAFELPSTLAHALQRRAALTPDRVALRFLAETRDQAVVLSYRELDQRARTIAGALQAEAGFGERAVLLFPSGPDYVAALFGCL